jgi:hypothetical protein
MCRPRSMSGMMEHRLSAQSDFPFLDMCSKDVFQSMNRLQCLLSGLCPMNQFEYVVSLQPPCNLLQCYDSRHYLHQIYDWGVTEADHGRPKVKKETNYLFYGLKHSSRYYLPFKARQSLWCTIIICVKTWRELQKRRKQRNMTTTKFNQKLNLLAWCRVGAKTDHRFRLRSPGSAQTTNLATE